MLPEIAALAKRQASTLSGGQHKRVALGQVLMSDTQLLLLDEPFERDDYANRRCVVIQEATALTGSRTSAPAYICSAPFTAAPGTTLYPIFASTDSMA
jgi:ABC-type molybdenum transport system ATPase subunit/photorepair protein PhrA